MPHFTWMLDPAAAPRSSGIQRGPEPEEGVVWPGLGLVTPPGERPTTRNESLPFFRMARKIFGNRSEEGGLDGRLLRGLREVGQAGTIVRRLGGSVQ